MNRRLAVCFFAIGFVGACSSGTSTPIEPSTSSSSPASSPSDDTSTTELVIPDVTPVSGEPCSYLAREEVEASVGARVESLTVTGESCIWSFAPLASGEFAGERPNLRMGILGNSDEFDAASADPTNTPIAELGDSAFIRDGDGVSGGETYVLIGDRTVVVVVQLLFADQNEQASLQERLARLVLGRL